MQCVITADGLSSIRAGTREVAKGGWHCGNAEWFFNIGANKVQASKVTEKTFQMIDQTHARVRQVQQDLVTSYDYTFDGNDLTIVARVENNNENEEMQGVQFSGLSFTFSRPPTGIMPVQHYTYFRYPGHGIGMCHPSFWDPIGGSYATDDGVGVGVSPWKTGLTRTLILWDYADWVKQEKGLSRNLSYFVISPVPPLGARTYQMKLRLSTTRTGSICSPHIKSTSSPPLARCNTRRIIAGSPPLIANKSQQAIWAKNPYGFHDGVMRLDLPEGVKAFCDNYISALSKPAARG